MPVTGEGTASICVSGHGSNKIRILNLLIKVTDKGLTGCMCGGHLVEWSGHIFTCLGVNDSYHAVYTHVLENCFYLLVVSEVGKTGQQCIFQVFVSLQYIQSLLIKWHTDCFGIFPFGLLRYVLHTSINDIGFSETVQVTDTATNQALEHEYITIYGIVLAQFAKVCIVNLVSFFQCKIKRVAIDRLCNLILVKGIVLGQSLLDAIFDDGADSVKASRYSILGTHLLNLTARFVLIEERIHVNILMFFLYPMLELSNIISGY